jgi:pimeloyl-ACP methyl ester carboxylesterase
MTLSASIFPPLAMPAIEIDFNRLTVSRDGTLPGDGGLTTHAAALAHRLSREPAWLTAEKRIAVAHSFGGMLLLHCLSEGMPALNLNGMVLIATTAGPMYDVVRVSVLHVGDRTLRVPFAPLLPLWNLPIVTRLAKRAFTRGRLCVESVDFRTLSKTTDFAVDAAGWRNTDWRAMRSYRSAMKGFDVRDRLRDITVPGIVLHGTRDSLFPVDVGRTLADGLPNAVYREIEGAGHALPLTHGDVVLEAVREIR